MVNMMSIDVLADCDHSAMATDIHALVRARGWARILVLVDLPGASPSQIALKLTARLGTASRVITGINNALLLAALQHAETQDDLDQLARLVIIRGRRAIRREVDTM